MTTFSGLKLLQSDGLKEQLKLRAFVDNRREESGKALLRVPPKKGAAEGGRAWLVLKLQSCLKKEWAEGIIKADPNDLEKGDLGCESCAPRRKRAAKAAPSDGDEAAAPKGRGGRKRKAPRAGAGARVG